MSICRKLNFGSSIFEDDKSKKSFSHILDMQESKCDCLHLPIGPGAKNEHM